MMCIDPQPPTIDLLYRMSHRMLRVTLQAKRRLYQAMSARGGSETKFASKLQDRVTKVVASDITNVRCGFT